MKDRKVLVLYYTQSGQLEEVVRKIAEPFVNENVQVDFFRVSPEKDFPFPWTSEAFFDAMPETVLAVPTKLSPIELKEERYDLIFFAYQPWFLSLSIPASSALLNPSVKEVLKDTPVVTVIAARNMWLNAQEQAKKMIAQAGGRLVGNIALVDRSPNLVSVVTILHWMLTGKKDKYLGIFPKPGVSEKDIQGAIKFGETVMNSLRKSNWNDLQFALQSQGAVEVKESLMFVEERAPKLFLLWAKFIVKSKNRKQWLIVFKYYLLFALFLVAPVVLGLNFLFFRMFFLRKIALKKKYYAGVDLVSSAHS